MSAQLIVTLLPPEANGQWRFPWDLAWRNSGQVVRNLVGRQLPDRVSQSARLPGVSADS